MYFVLKTETEFLKLNSDGMADDDYVALYTLPTNLIQKSGFIKLYIYIRL